MKIFLIQKCCVRFLTLMLMGMSLDSGEMLSAAPQNQQRLTEATRLNDEVIRLYGTGQYADAIDPAEKALAIWESELGPNHQETALGLGNLGELHRALANYAAAKPLHERALRIRERVLGLNHADVALSATWVAMVNESLGDYRTAEKHYQKALKIREALFGAEHPEVASGLNNLANLMKTQSRLDEAEKLFLRGLEIRRRSQGADHPDSAPSLDNLASLYREQGRLADAEPLYLQALRIREKHFGKEHPDTAFTLNNLAVLYDNQGRYSDAEPLFTRALKIREKLLGYDHPQTAVTAGNLGGMYERQGNFGSAEKLYQRAMTSLEKTAGPDHLDTGIIANNLASLYQRQSRDKDSERLYETALRIFEQQTGSEHRHVAQVLNNLGGLRERQGDFPTAENHYRRSLEIRRRELGEEHPDTAESINNLALLLAADMQVAEAIPLLQQSLAIRQKTLGEQHPTTVGALENLAAYQEQQKDQQSIASFELARRGIRRHVVRELPALAERELSFFLKVNYEKGFHQALSCALLHTDQQDVIERSAGWLLNGKAVGVEALTQRNLAQRTGDSDTAPTDWVELDQLRAAIPAKAVFIDIARFRRFDFELRPGAATWLPSHFAAWILPATGQGDIQFVDLGPADAIDAVISQVREQLLLAPGKDGSIAAASEQKVVIELNQTLQSAAELVWKPLTPHLKNCEDLLLSPDGNLWLLPWAALPDGEKDEDGNVSLLVEHYPLRLLVSGRDLIRKKVEADILPSVIVANPEFDQANGEKEQSIRAIFKKIPPPDEDTVRAFSARSLLPDVPPLPNTEIEAITIQPELETYTGQSVTVYKQRYALESVVKALRSPKIAVFATHGFFMPQQQVESNSQRTRFPDNTRSSFLDVVGKPLENPLLRCGLLFSGCNQRGSAIGSDDGILTGAEVTGIDLRGTELVLLSACETGLGDVNHGEGVAGLRQAFQLAGAQAVVASLWQVSDRETTLLVNDFFHNLAAGQSKAEALRNAQLSRISKRRERFGAAHPYFWAAFTLTGQ